MRTLTPPPHSSTSPSLFLAAEAFEDVPQGLGKSIFLDVRTTEESCFVAETATLEAFKNVPQSHGNSMFFY